jgi:putative ABC transport system substrate-binding protein
LKRVAGGLLAAWVSAAPVAQAKPALPGAPIDVTPDFMLQTVRNIESSTDVAIYPIFVAGPVVADSTRRAVNRIAMAAGPGAIAVIYPDMGEPYRSVFAQIIEGIEAKTKAQVTNFAVGANSDIGELRSALRRQDAKVVIALGRQGMKVASALDGKIGLVVGGVLAVPESEMREQTIVNSLSPDPALLFSRLKGLMPGVRRVYTVYDARQNGWLIQLAKEGARAQGLELVAHDVQDLRGAMRAYQEILSVADPRQDALWLPQDSTAVEEGTVLPMVLQESWNRNLAVFSSSFGHVRRGVLFSLYPNNVELGRRLAGSALGYLSGEAAGRSITPLREVLMAVNLRTAQHLGIDTGRQRGFDMVFPEK